MLYTCKYCNKPKNPEEMEVNRLGKPSYVSCKKCRYKRQNQWKLAHPKTGLCLWARHRAKRYNVPFSITPKDFDLPTVCPVLGIEMKPGKGKLHDGSPTLDRIKPELGYVPGNVLVISYKANRMKNNGSCRDLQAVAAYAAQGNTEGRLYGNRTEPVTTNTSDELLISEC